MYHNSGCRIGLRQYIAWISINILVTVFFCDISLAKPTGLLFKVTSHGQVIYVNTVVPDHTYPNAGIKINTLGYSLMKAGTECTPSDNGFCLFSTSDKISTPITISGSPGDVDIILCLNGPKSLSCQHYTISISTPSVLPHFIYVTNGDSTVSICPLNADGSLGTCSVSTGNGTFSFGGFGSGAGITLNAARTLAYVVNTINGSISICPINPDGTFGTCTVFNDPTFNYPTGSIGLNVRNNLAYIANALGNSVSICPVNPDGSLSACTISDGNGTFSGLPTQVLLNSATTFAYVANENNNTIAGCPVNNDGSFGTCTLYDGNGTFTRPQGFDFDASEAYLYVGNLSFSSTMSTIAICPVNSDGSLGICTSTTGTPNFNFDYNVVICPAMSSPSHIGYIPNNGTNFVYLCPIDAATGALGSCTTSSGNGTFNSPSAVALG